VKLSNVCRVGGHHEMREHLSITYVGRDAAENRLADPDH
jgi:hypothetical protein